MKNFFVLFFVFCFLPSALSEENENAFWQVSSLPASGANLSVNGSIIGTITSSQLRNIIEVQHRLEAVSGIQVPLYIQGSQFANAFAFESPGKDPYIAFTFGLIKHFGDDPDALANVLGHEMGHLHQHHPLNGLKRNETISALASILGAIIDAKTKSNGSARVLDRYALNNTASILSLKFTRDDEAEADSFGFKWANQSGYSVEGAVRVFEYFLHSYGDGIFFMQTHPLNADRIAKAKDFELALTSGNKQIPSETPTKIATHDIYQDKIKPKVRDNSAYIKKIDSDFASVANKVSADKLKKLEDAAKKGDPEAQSKYGLILLLGEDEDKKTTGVSWLEKAASQGNDRATMIIGLLHISGKRLPKDPQLALTMLKKTSEKNNPLSQYLVGTLLFSGIAGEKNPIEAEKYLLMASESGFVPAKTLLAANYLTGKVFKKDVQASISLLKVAEEQDSEYAELMLGLIYSGGLVEKDPPKSYEFFMKAAQKGNPFAMFRVGTSLNSGFGVSQNKDQAMMWLVEAKINQSQSAELLIQGKNKDIEAVAKEELADDLKKAFTSDYGRCLVQLADKALN